MYSGFPFPGQVKISVCAYKRDQVPAIESSEYLFLIPILVQQTPPAWIKLLPWEFPSTTAIFQKELLLCMLHKYYGTRRSKEIV